MQLLAVAMLDLGQDADAADEMLVDRVVVVHVELHHRHDLVEIGDELAQNAGLVHAAHIERGIAVGCQHIHEEAIGLLVATQIAVDQLERTGEQFQRLGVIFEPVSVCEPEQPQQVHRVALEHALIGHVDAVIVDDEIAGAGKFSAAARKVHEEAVEAGNMLALFFLKGRAENTGEIAHALGRQEVVLHEALDRRQAGMACIAKPLCDIALNIEMQPLFRLSGEKVHVAAHRPEKIFRLAKLEIFLAGENALPHQVFRTAHAVKIFADPEQRVQVAQAALAVLHIGLDQITALARLGMAQVALGKLGLAVFGARILDHFLVETLDHFFIEWLLAADEARFQNGGADRHVGARLADALVDVAGGMADLQPHVPQHVEHIFHDLLAPGRLLVGQEKKEIDVGSGRQRAAPIAADGDYRQALPPTTGSVSDKHALPQNAAPQ